jgi:type IV secretion system protein VirD4
VIDTKKIKRFVLPNLPYVFLWWLFAKVGEAYRLSPGRDTLRKLIGTMSALNTAFAQPLPALNLFDIMVGLLGAAAIYVAVLYRKYNAKKWRKEVLCYKGCQWRRPENIAVRTLAAQANGHHDTAHGRERRVL